MIKAKFPNVVTIYITRKSKKRGIWRSGFSVIPKRMNSITKEPFTTAILPQENLERQKYANLQEKAQVTKIYDNLEKSTSSALTLKIMYLPLVFTIM